MDIERILRSTPATLTVTFYGDETPVDADAAVTVTVTKADGTELASGSASHLGEVGSGQYTYDLAPQANLNLLTVTWAGKFSDVDGSITTAVEVVGGFYFTLAELRAADAALADPLKYPLAKLIEARDATEVEFERFCERAFVPRFAREYVVADGTNTIYLSNPEPLRVLSIDGVAPTAMDYRRDGKALIAVGDTFAAGEHLIEYEYGAPYAPLDIKLAALRRARGRLVSARARIDERATVMQIPDFGTFNLATPGRGGSMTGIPDIDVVLIGHAWSGSGGVGIV